MGPPLSWCDRTLLPMVHRSPPRVRGTSFRGMTVPSDTRYGHAEVRGSRASRSPSPTRLNARVVVNSAIPGNNMSHGAYTKADADCASIAPHDGVVSGTP